MAELSLLSLAEELSLSSSRNTTSFEFAFFGGCFFVFCFLSFVVVGSTHYIIGSNECPAHLNLEPSECVLEFMHGCETNPL